jgi:Type IV secretory pathway, VirB4 components
MIQIKEIIEKFKSENQDEENILIKVEDIINCTYQTTLDDTDPFYIRDGKGYRSCLLVYDVPDEVPLSWLSNFNDDNDIYTTIDIIPIDLQNVKKSIRNAVKEFQDRIIKSNDEFEQMDAMQKREKMLELIANLTGGKERILAYTIRIYLYAHTLKALEKKQAKIIRLLSEKDFEASVYANEQMLEEKNKQKSYDITLLQGGNQHEVRTRTLAGGYPFRYFDLQDPTGVFWGRNEIGAKMFWDLFTNDGLYRIFYNAIIIGKMGSGKSTIISKIIRQQRLAGNRIRIADITGEHVKHTKALGGKVLKVDGIEVATNPHALFLTIRKDEYTNDDLKAILVRTIGVARNFLKLFAPELRKSHLDIYAEIVNDLYVERGALDKLLTIENEVIYSEVKLELIKRIVAIKDEPTKKVKFRLMQELEITIDSLTTGLYANYFNKRSTYNIYDEEIICYVLRDITADKSILVPQFYLLVMMFWNELIFYGTPEKEKIDSNKITFEQAKKYLTIFDESHYVFNASMHIVLQTLGEYFREARKYCGGSVLGTHGVKDFVADNKNTKGKELVENLFELTQYKIIMKQDINSKEKLLEVFGEEIKEYQLQNIHKFAKGECILNISGFQTQKLHVSLSDLEKEFLAGGK